MGNEQSTSSASGVSSSISFLAGKRGTSVKRSTQIVVVRPGQDPVGDPADDAEIKKLREIRRFLPVLKSALPGMRDSPEVFAKVSSKPILKFCYRLQEHLAVCAKAISKEQASLHTTMKHVDHTCSVAVSKYQEAAEHTDKLAHAMKKIKSVNQKLLEAESILIALFPQAEELGQLLNEVLPPDQQLLPIQMPKMTETDFSFINPDVQLDKVKPLDLKRTVAFANFYLTQVASILNKFSVSAEERIMEIERRLEFVESVLTIIEEKVKSVGDLQSVAVNNGNVMHHNHSSTTKEQNKQDADSEEKSSLSDKESHENWRMLPNCEDPMYAKYFKMLKMGVVEAAVKQKMIVDGLDPSVLDCPDDPSINKIEHIESDDEISDSTECSYNSE
ncbi:hypothetical protein QR680_000026 [Steinernema hermaphroditum]|uniref:BLOC-1-related complex subunit 5 n=1 Tax=Steinernema hermaphroditum TaxID=289476 RepID=A0AA39GT07_9BILA|nr:hypothetical protein QR680_000026 [Steinernema hermaphroditum]